MTQTTTAAAFHQTPHVGVFFLTGGGSSFIDDLLGTAGASRSVLEARVPYAERALMEVLGGRPDQACSADTARSMAMAAFQRALMLGDRPADAFGFSATASLATDRTKRGACRAHVGIQTVTETLCLSAEFDAGLGRAEQEAELNALCWHALSTLTPLDVVAPPSHTSLSGHGQPAWRDLILGTADAVLAARGGHDHHDGHALFPGSFNPLHDGHRRMRDYAQELLGLPVAWELCVTNIEKPMLDFVAIEERLAQFDTPVWLTRLPRFQGKARRFRGCTFVVGTDTLVRIADPRFYTDDRAMHAALAELASLGIRFLVFGRHADGRFVTLNDLTLPDTLMNLCTGVSEQDFRVDVSSSSLRGR